MTPGVSVLFGIVFACLPFKPAPSATAEKRFLDDDCDKADDEQQKNYGDNLFQDHTISHLRESE